MVFDVFRARQTLFALALSIVGLNLEAPTLQAQMVVFQHTGATDPTTEGWTRTIGSGGSTNDGLIINDLGTTDAWFVEDTGIANQTIRFFSQDPDASTVALGNTNGWELSTNLRVVDGSIGVFQALTLDYIDGSTQWIMTFDLDGSGDPVLRSGGLSHTVTGGAGAYHLYEMRFNPLENNVDIFVDGIEELSNVGGFAASATTVRWGAIASNGTGLGHYNSVQFSVVPEPTSMTLIGVAFVLGAGYLRRRKASVSQGP